MWRSASPGRQALICILGLWTFIPNPLQASDTLDTPSDLPRLAREVSEKVRTWRGDARLVRIVVTKNHEGQSTGAFRLSFYAISRTTPVGLVLSRRSSRTEVEEAPYEVEKSALIPVPDFAVDLPQALTAAQNAGMRGQLEEATLAVKIPLAKLPVLVWSIRTDDKPIAATYFVDAFTGAYLGSTPLIDPRLESNALLDHAGRSLKEALLHEPAGSPQSMNPWMDFVVLPILNAKDVFECNALGGQWRSTMCLP